MKYNEKIKELYNSESCIGSFQEEDSSIGTGLVGAPACGDVMKLQLKIKQDFSIPVEERVIEDAKVLVFGCGSAKASSTYATERLIGKTVRDALSIKDSEIAKDLELPAIKNHCSVLAEESIKKAVEDYRVKNERHSIIIDEGFSLDISEEAEAYLERVLKKKNENNLGIRVELEESNCGLSYKLKYIKDASELRSNDIIYKSKKNLTIVVNKKISELINKTEMIFKKEDLKEGIVFVNPNEKGKCGCGTNFKI